MKKIIIFLSLLFALSIPMSSAYAADACETILCLWGKMSGSDGSNCSSAENDFFSIIVTKDGGFLSDHTFDARQTFLNQCTVVDPSFITQVMDKFGRVH